MTTIQSGEYMISIIIPTLNEEEYLEPVIKSIKNQHFKDYEIIVSDGSSDDKTIEIAKKYTDKFIVSKKRGISVQRNTGVKIAKGDILLFLDADTTLKQDFLTHMNNAFNDKNVVSAVGYVRSYGRKRDRVTLRSYSEAVRILSVLRPYMCGSCMAVRKNIFEKVGGFDENLYTAEDVDIGLKIRKYGKCKFIRNAIAFTSPRRLQNKGSLGITLFHVKNLIRYELFKRSSNNFPHDR